MINSMCGSLGTPPKTENLSPTASVADSNTLFDLVSTDQPTTTSPSTLQNSNKFDSDFEIHSPDSSIWESLFADHLDQVVGSPDFMICSPKRVPTGSGGPDHFGSPIHPSEFYSQRTSQSCSVPCTASQLMGAFSSSSMPKAKPVIQTVQQPESPALPSLLGYGLDEEGSITGGFVQGHAGTAGKLSHLADVGYGSQCSSFDCGPATGSRPRSRGSHELYMSGNNGGGGGGGGGGSNVYSHTTLPLQGLERGGVSNSLQEMNGGGGEGSGSHDSGLQLVHLLLACAEAVAKEDYPAAHRCLLHLSRAASPLGDSMQRVASYFADALSARLSPPPSPQPQPVAHPAELLKIYQILYQACPYIKFAHFTANHAIFEAFTSETRVHVIDLDILQGYQWPAFLQALAGRPGGPPALRLTGLGSQLELVRETGRRLADLAHSLRVPFEFHAVADPLEELRPRALGRRIGEALAINAVNRLHHVAPHALGPLLALFRDQAPKIVTLVEQEASHNSPYFLSRFLEALHYYSATFDSLDATFPTDSPQRARVEKFIFAAEINNIVACEGAARVERHERLERWRRVMEGKGFRGVPLSANAVNQSRMLLSIYTCDGYRLNEDAGCLLLGWQDRPLIAVSAWRC